MKDSKPGKVLRIDPLLHALLTKKRKGREPWSAVLRRELGLKPRRGKPDFVIHYVLASDLHTEKGELLLTAARRKVKASELKVRKVKEVP